MAKITWEVLRGKLLRILDDLQRESTDTPTWTDPDLLDYIDLALTAFTDHTAQEKVFTYTPTAAADYVELPDDMHTIGPVWFPLRRLLSPIKIEPGLIFASTTVSTTSSPWGYYEFPRGKLNLTRALGSGEELTVYYWSYWGSPVGSESTIEVPKWAHEALLWYCVGLAMSKPGVLAAQLNEWKTKRDSGSPIDNPAKTYAKYAREQYDIILANHAPQDRTGLESTLT